MGDDIFVRRIIFISLLIAVVFIAFFSRALQLQVISSTKLTERAKKQHTRKDSAKAGRGAIYDRNGKKLVESINAVSVYAVPGEIADVPHVSEQLAALTGQSREFLQRRLATKGGFAWIIRQIEPEKAQVIRDAGIKGVYFRPEGKRYHLYGRLAAPVLGVVGVDSQGLEGLELAYENYLRGVSENIVWAVDAKGNRVFQWTPANSTAGEEAKSVVLTLDSALQHIVEKHLGEAVENTGAKGGVAIVMDPATGEILAFAVLPAFDPTSFRGTVTSLKNPALTNIFDPGSIFKPFLIAAALDAGVVTPGSKFHCENGEYRIANRVIGEARGGKFGALTVADILKHSSNIGCAKIAEKLGRERFHEYIAKFGFGTRTGIDAPGEALGLLAPVSRWTRVDTANIGFGQGVGVTAIQLVAALGAIANGGNLMRPYLVSRVVDATGKVVLENKPTVRQRVITNATARQVAEMMKNVVNEPDGTGKLARTEGIVIAGKTGTAQKYDHSRRAFSRERVVASFEGFMPADDPKLVLLVSLDEPKSNRWGGVAAAPVFKKISEEIMARNIGGILPPSKVLSGGDVAVSTAPRRDLQLVSRHKAPAAEVGVPVDPGKTPDFRGMTLREAMLLAQERNIRLAAQGNGWAYKQEPPAGQPLGSSRSCVIYFSDGK